MSAVGRLNQDLRTLEERHETRLDRARELRHDQRSLTHDRGDLRHARDTFDRGRKDLKGERASLQHHREQLHDRLEPIRARRAELQAELEQSVSLTNPQGDPEIQGRLDALQEREDALRGRIEPRIAADVADVDRLKTKIHTAQTRMASERKAIKKDRREVAGDRRQLDRAREREQNARHKALKDLRPAEYKMNLHDTNKARRALGLNPVDHVIRPANLNTVQGCAQFLLHSKNVSFWDGLSTGSDRKNVERLARGLPARVPATGGTVRPNLRLMQALVDMAKHGPVQITALTGGVHSSNSNHYRGTAVDLSIHVGNPAQLAAIANRHGGYRNSESDHIHLDF